MAIGRVGNNQLTRTVLSNIQNQLQTQNKLFSQISANKRVIKPSDDPVASSQILSLSNQIITNDQYQNNIETAKMWTNITDSALRSANEVWMRVSELAVSSADGTKSPSDLQSMAEEVEQLLENLVQIGNTSNAGKYIFSGSKTSSPAFTTEEDSNTGKITGVFYQGNSFSREIKTSEKGSTAINSLGSNAGQGNKTGTFIDSNQNLNAFNTLINLRERLLNNNIVGFSQPDGILEQVNSISKNFTQAQVEIGGAQQVLELDRNLMIEQNANVQEFLSEVGELDIAAAIMELNNAQNTYEASLAAAGRITQKGLIDYI
jgi:flagellar hook-associated protein 3 FlgL